jgi:GTP1/Obg family GTP-binding protein
MLKRLSFGNSSSDQLQLPALGITTSTYSQSSSRSPNQQPIYSTSPTSIASSAPRSRRNSNNNTSNTNANDKRNEQESIQSLNKFLKELNQILISFNELKELVTAVARVEKRLSKELITLVTGNGFEKDGPSYRRVSKFYCSPIFLPVDYS